MNVNRGRDKDFSELDELIEEITVDAYGDDEQLWAFREAFEDDVPLPADAHVVGEPVSVVAVDYDGNERRGLFARCRKEDGSEHVVTACDLLFPKDSAAARHVAAYRRWLGISPYPEVSSPKKRAHKAAKDDIDMGEDIDLVAVAVKENAISCRIPGKDRVITLRTGGPWEVVPGEIITVTPRKTWRYGGHPYLSGEIRATRLDVDALGLTPLGLEEMGVWDPKRHYWGEPGERKEEWAKPIIKKGKRIEYEMEQVLPGEDPDDPDMDPIIESIELRDAGDHRGADRALMALLSVDLRCLDAHAHLGNSVFDHFPEKAIRHYETGVRIGELSLGKSFKGLLPWGHIDNRPFLRCLQGYGLCLWRLRRFKEAEEVFIRMLWLNPTDNQGVRSLLDEVRRGEVWRADY